MLPSIRSLLAGDKFIPLDKKARRQLRGMANSYPRRDQNARRFIAVIPDLQDGGQRAALHFAYAHHAALPIYTPMSSFQS